MNARDYSRLVHPSAALADDTTQDCSCSRGGSAMFCEHNDRANDVDASEFPDACVHCGAPPSVDCACYDFADDDGDSIESLGLRGVVGAR